MIALLGTSLVACMAPIEIQVGEPGLAPAIAVSPTTLVFEDLAPGETAVASVTLTSAGTERLVLDTPQISDGSFALLTPLQDPVLEPGESWVLDVVWTANHETVQVATIVIESNDPDQDVLLVPVSGELSVGELAFDRNHDFGVLELGCDDTTTLALENTGSGPVTVDELSVDGSAYGLVDPPELPLTLAAGETLGVRVAFDPVDEGDALGTLAVHSELGDLTAELLGTAELPPGDTVTLTAGDPQAVDLVWLVDSSGSMFDELQALRQSFAHLVDGLEGAGLDWQVAAIDRSDGCSTWEPLASSSEVAISQFADQLFGGTFASERLLKVAADALDRTVAGDCNQDLLRDDSLVHVVTASDEHDQSPLAWDSYVAQMQDRLGDDERLQVSAFVGPEDDGYGQAADATGGVLLPFGAPDLAEQMFSLADASARCGARTWVALPADTDPDSVVVLRDGVEETGFQLENDQLVLDEPVGCDEVVEVRYLQWPSCLL